MPGGVAENISISRLKPAVVPADEEGSEATPSPPRSPRPPGRPPRPPTNPPPPSDRQTRSQHLPTDRQPVVLLRRLPENSSTSVPAASSGHEPNDAPDINSREEFPVLRSRNRRKGARHIADYNQLQPQASLRSQSPVSNEASPAETPRNSNPMEVPPSPSSLSLPTRFFTRRSEGKFSRQARSHPVKVPVHTNIPSGANRVPQESPENPTPDDDPPADQHNSPGHEPSQRPGGNTPASRNRVTSFSRPSPGDFSYPRSRPNVSYAASLAAILEKYANC